MYEFSVAITLTVIVEETSNRATNCCIKQVGRIQLLVKAEILILQEVDQNIKALGINEEGRWLLCGNLNWLDMPFGICQVQNYRLNICIPF